MSAGGRRLPEWLVLPGLVVGGTLLTCGIGMLVSSGVGLLTDGRALAALAIPGAATLALGAALTWSSARRSPSGQVIRPATGFAAVTFAWIAAAAVGAVPLMAAGSLPSPLDAYFEAMSGFTTLGATLLSDIEAQPDGVLFWRQLTQWLGGIGIVVLVVAVAPISGPGLQRAFYAEVSGVTTDRLTPRIVDTAKIIAGVYLAFSAAAVAAYLIAGMSLFDAVAQMFSSIATGGFSTRNASIADFDSLAIELIAISVMILGAVNFAFYWRAIRGGTLRPQAAEVRAFLIILVGGIALITLSLVISDNQGLWEGLRGAAFSATSLMTTTGYTTVDFDSWNEFARLSLLVLMVTGGCAGSTAGGIKVIRVLLLGKTARQEVDRQLQPQSVQVLRLGGRAFPEQVRAAVLGFALVYALIYILGALAYAASGLDLVTAISATTSGLNLIGPGLGDIGAIENYESVSPGGLVVTIALMLTGRLEIFTVVALLAALRVAISRLP